MKEPSSIFDFKKFLLILFCKMFNVAITSKNEFRENCDCECLVLLKLEVNVFILSCNLCICDIAVYNSKLIHHIIGIV